MKEFDQIVDNKSYESPRKHTHVYGVRFWTPPEAAKYGFTDFFDENDNVEQKYALAVVMVAPSTFSQAALIDVNKVKFDESSAYRAGVWERIRSIFGESMTSPGRKMLGPTKLSERLMNIDSKKF